MPYSSFTRERGLAEALYAEELDFSRYIWLRKPRRRDRKRPGRTQKDLKCSPYILDEIVTWEVTLEPQQGTWALALV